MKASQSRGEVVGIVGGGQLGRMLALAGLPLSIECRVLEPGDNPPAAVAAECLKAPFEDATRAIAWANQVDAVTYEFENIPTETLEAIAATVPVRPSPQSLRVSCDRMLEKQLFGKLGIDTTRWQSVSNWQELQRAADYLGFPLVIKTRRFGYDGKGQAIARNHAELESAWLLLGGAASKVGLLVEEMIPFTSEVSQISVRGLSGEIRHYPLTRNVHREGILRFSAPVLGEVESVGEQARQSTTMLLEDMGHVGVLAVEFFENQGQLIANEIAPRVHNSGHWTQDGADICQFENHLRAVVGWPLGATRPVGHACMINLVGYIPPVGEILAIEGAHLHLYGKEVRAGRKVGHVNLRCKGTAELEKAIRQVATHLPGEDVSRWLKQISNS